MRVSPLVKLVQLSRSPSHTDDNDGFFEPLSPPAMWASIQPQGPVADGRNVQHLVKMRYHPGVTMDTRIVVDRTRELFVRGIQNVDDLGVEMNLVCEEIIK